MAPLLEGLLACLCRGHAYVAKRPEALGQSFSSDDSVLAGVKHRDCDKDKGSAAALSSARPTTGSHATGSTAMAPSSSQDTPRKSSSNETGGNVRGQRSGASMRSCPDAREADSSWEERRAEEERAANARRKSTSFEAPKSPQQQQQNHHHPVVKQSLDLLIEAGLSRSPMHVAWCSPRELVRDVHDLRWVGQGSQGIVYEGVWQGATVAVKWSIADELDAGAYELLFSRLLSHPNVVQTYDAKVAVLDKGIFERTGSNTLETDVSSGGMLRAATQGSSSTPLATPTAPQRCNSFQSDEGFGDPLGRASALADVRDMLHLIGAKPGQHITQMIMEYCDQGSLLTAIGRGIFLPASRFGPKVALRALYRTAREVAQGMFHLHCAKVIHGDLKPANVLLMNSRKDRRGFVAKVSDFGLAQYCPALGHVTDAPWGTLVFMAPERFRQSILLPASDVWSFGVMLWQMYTAKLPYEGARQAQLMLGITTNTLALSWPKGTPDSLRCLAQSCMAYNPEDRPSFDMLMQQLAVLESEVRMEGVRLSFSHEQPSGAPAFARQPSQPGQHPASPSRANMQQHHMQRKSISAVSDGTPTTPTTEGGSGAWPTPPTPAAAAAAAAAAMAARKNTVTFDEARGSSSSCRSVQGQAQQQQQQPGGVPRASSGALRYNSAAVAVPTSSSGMLAAFAATAPRAGTPVPAAGGTSGTMGSVRVVTTRVHVPGQAGSGSGHQSPIAAMAGAHLARQLGRQPVKCSGMGSPTAAAAAGAGGGAGQTPFEAACSAAVAAAALMGCGQSGTGHVGVAGARIHFSTSAAATAHTGGAAASSAAASSNQGSAMPQQHQGFRVPGAGHVGQPAATAAPLAASPLGTGPRQGPLQETRPSGSSGPFVAAAVAAAAATGGSRPGSGKASEGVSSSFGAPCAAAARAASPGEVPLDFRSSSFEVSPSLAAGVGSPALQPVVVTGVEWSGPPKH